MWLILISIFFFPVDINEIIFLNFTEVFNHFFLKRKAFKHCLINRVMLIYLNELLLRTLEIDFYQNF